MKNTRERNTKRKKKGSNSKQKTPLESVEHTIGSPKRRKQNLRPKPIINNTKQVVQGDGQKT